MNKKIVLFSTIFFWIFTASFYTITFAKTEPWQDVTQDIDYEIKEVSQIETNYVGATIATFLFEQIIFEGDSDVLLNINHDLENKCEDFCSEYEEDFFDIVHENGAASDYHRGNFPYSCKMTVQSVFCTKSIISIRMKYEWYAGGNLYHEPYCYNYNYLTGKLITIEDALGLDTNSTIELITNTIYKFCDDARNTSNNIPDIHTINDILNEYDITECNYFVDNTGLYVCFPHCKLYFDDGDYSIIKLT